MQRCLLYKSVDRQAKCDGVGNQGKARAAVLPAAFRVPALPVRLRLKGALPSFFIFGLSRACESLTGGQHLSKRRSSRVCHVDQIVTGNIGVRQGVVLRGR
jgi:hypothetical protein